MSSLVAQILIVIVVLTTIIFLMIEKYEKIKTTFAGAIISILIFAFLIWDEEHTEKSLTETVAEFINFEAIVVIFSISIIVALVKKAGFFDFISLYMVKLTKGEPKKLLLTLGGLTFFISMFFDNLSAIIILGSLTIIICKQIDLDPKPYVLFVAINTVIGGLPTPISSLPNIIFYSSYNQVIPEGSKISFIQFMGYAFPYAILLFILAFFYFMILFRNEIFVDISFEKKEQIARINPWSAIDNKTKIWKSIGLLVILFTGFLIADVIHLHVDIIALIVTGIGLFLFNAEMKEFLEHNVEWDTIIFFISLFVIMGVLDSSEALSGFTSILNSLLQSRSEIAGQIFVALIVGLIGLIITALITSVPSAVIFSNIFSSLISSSVGLWFAFVFTVNISGSLTPIGSMTILMALNILREEKRPLSFFEYLKYISPFVLLMQILGISYSILLIAIGGR